MRIIAGEFRGRHLLSPGDATRPITDRVKQSVFDILSPLIPDARVYDCFSGSGSMGLECLSRGAAHATFFEADRMAADRLRQNVAALRVQGRSTIHRGDLFRWFGDFSTAPDSPGVSLIFLDPPYRFLRERPDDLQHIAGQIASRHASGDATIVFRHDAADRLAMPPFVVADTREYGGMTVEFLRAAAPPAVESAS